METITISENSRSENDRSLLNYIKSLNYVKINYPNAATKQAINELESNKGTSFGNAKDALSFLKK